eukprot:XP_019926394.1 PREDICTED: uncharacterized protein LOC105336776 isoform X2 [Crassostrea gigas]
MTDQGEKVKAASLPIEIQRKSKMEGSTTDSDFSDLDIQTFEKKPSTSPPPTRSNNSPYGSPHKRGYPPNMDNFSVDKFNSEQSPKKRNLNQYPFGPGKENLFNLNWTNSLSSRDSAIGGSLMSTLGSALTDTSSSYETNSESELSSSGHSVYGRYQKIDGSSGDSSEEEVLVLHRLPGENLGMILGIDSDPAHQTVRSVYVKTVTIGGAAYRATGSKKGIQEGDQILQINGTDLNILTHDECLTVLREMPLRVILKIRRGKKKVKTAVKLSPPLSLGSRGSFGDSPSPLIYSESSSYSESEEDDGKMEGFAQIHVEIDKHPNESLGLSVVPSYGSTRQYYQIKRLLPSGAAARSQQIRVGDRLVSCNGINLRNVSQSKCLSVLKSEGNSGDLELELLRPKENEEQLEISLKVSRKDSPLTLHSPSQQRKNFIADIPESDSDNEVVLNKFQYIDNTGVDRDLRPHNLRPNIPSEKLDNSDADQTKRNIKLKSTNSKMDEGGDSWNYAVPPPMEFSTYGPAVPPPAEFSEGQSPIFNQSNNGIPVTNIDEIINSYRPVVQSNDNYIPQADTDDTGFHAHENGSLNNSLTDFEDNIPGEEGLNVMDGFQGINNMNLEEDQGKNVEDNDNDVEPFIPPAPVNTEDLDFDTKHSNEDDDFIVPVKVQRQKHIPFESTVNVSSTGSSEIEEEHIVPSIEERRRIQPSATIKLEEKKYEELQPKPVPQPRVKPTIINVQHSPVPSSSATPEEPAVEEEIVSMEFKERQAGNESFLKKLGGEVEEEIVPVHVKRDQVKNVAKLAVITNMWSKSTSKSKDTASENNAEKKNLKSVINVLNSAPKQENSNKADDDKIDETKVVREEEKPEAKEQGIHKNVIKVEAPVSLDAENVNAIPEYVDTKSKNVDKKPDILDDKSPKLGSSSSEEIKATDTTLPPQTVTVNSTKVQVKTNVKENVSSTLATDSKDVPPSSSVASKATEESVSSSKPAEVSPPSPFKSSIGITKPTSLLSTIRSQNPSSATLKPLSSIKPIAVTSKTFSMGRPGGLSTSLSTGRHSLLSTIHGTSTSTKSTRSEEEPFLVSVLKGILGVGMKVSTTPEGFVKVDEIQSSGPIAKDGNIRVGDYLLSINNTELTGLPDSKIQQILRLLPRGIAKILVSVKPPPSDGAARPTNLSFGSSESTQSKHSPLSSPRTMSKTSSMSPAMSPRQPVASPLTPSSPKQPSTPTSKTPGEEPEVKVTINHDQHSPETKKTPPPVAPKPKHSMVPEQSKPGSHWGGGGYVSSAVGRSHSFGKKEPQTVESKPHIQPRKADYVSSARKTVHDKEEKEPIDTVVFASVDFNKMNANSRHSIGKPKEKNVPEPKMIPKGHVDYVSSACPAVPSTKTTSPKSKDISYSPYAYEEVSTKISPVSLNSALSPRRKSEDKFSFGATHPGNRTKEAEDIVVDNEEGKMVDEISAEHDKHPTVVMETKSLRAFLQKLDSSEKEASTPDLYSQNQNVVAENIAKDMLKTLEDGADNASFTYTTKTSANTSNDLLTNTNHGDQVVECMSVSLDASVACNDVVLDSPNPDSMAVDEVNVNTVASEGNNVNALLIQEPKSCTEQPSEDMDIVSECVNSEAVIGDSQEDLENIEIILNENSVDTCDSMPIDFLGGGISQNKLTSMDNCTTQSRRLWVFCAGEQQFSSDAVNISAINAALRAVAPLDLETLINQANEDLDSYGYGLDARLVIVAMNSSSLREGLGVRLSSVENGPLIVSGVMEGSLAEREGHIQLGDKFVSLDGVSASSLSPEAVMNEMEDSSSGHVIVLTRLEEDTEAPPPTPLAPPPTLPVSAPPDVPSEEPGPNVVEDEACNDFDGVVNDNENVELKVERPIENVDSDIKASETDFTVNGPENSVNSNELEKHESTLTPDSISVTIPDLAEVSSPQGSQDSGVDTQDSGVDTQDSGVDSPSALGTLSNIEDSDAKERPKVDVEEKQPLSNGDHNQVSSPISPLDSLGLLSTALSDDTDDDNAEKETFEVIMNKGVTGLGFLIEGGKASAKGDQPLTIKRIFKGGPAEKCGMLKVKDEILMVNNQDITEMRHTEAWTHLKFLDEGPVHLLIRRKVQQSSE